jgi:hypothetical protein
VPNRTPRRRLNAQRAQAVQARPYQETPSDVFLASSMPLAAAGIYGRLGKGPAPPTRPRIGAPATGKAQGNWVVTSDARGASAAYARGTGMGNEDLADTSPANESPYGSVSGQQARRVDTPPSMITAGGMARTPQFQHGRAIAHDRHIISKTGHTTSGNRQQATGGTPNPEASGPPRPLYLMFNRTLSRMYGTDSTRFLDNGQFHAAVLAGTRKFPLGQQGTEWSRVYGGTPGLAQWRPYASRGRFLPGAPQPTVKAEPGGPYRFGTLLQQGAPGDGPQKVYGGLPWGLHSPTLPSTQQTQPMIMRRFGQVKPVWNIRPQNSRTAGQSWSQSMVSLTGQQAVKLRAAPPIRQPGMNTRWLGT